MIVGERKPSTLIPHTPNILVLPLLKRTPACTKNDNLILLVTAMFHGMGIHRPYTYTILRLEHHAQGRRIRDLLFTKTQWERFVETLPGLQGFLKFPPVIDGPTATFAIDMENPDLPNSDSRALEIVHRAVLAHWTEDTLGTPGIWGIDIGGEDWYVKDNVAIKIATHLATANTKPWTQFLGASGWADQWISEHANENVYTDQRVLLALRQRSEAIHNTIYRAINSPDWPQYGPIPAGK